MSNTSLKARAQTRAKMPLETSESDDLRLGVVGHTAYLDGHVSSYRQKKAISQLAAGLPGIRKLVNRLRVAPCSPTSDRIIAENVLLALRNDPALRLYSIAVKATDGIVELNGALPDISARIAAEAAAWSVSGISHVVNHLQIIPAAGADAELTGSLRRGLNFLLGPYTDSVKLELTQGRAYLRGAVPTPEDRLAVEDMVRWHPLVRDVVNQLSVQKPDSLSSLASSA